MWPGPVGPGRRRRRAGRGGLGPAARRELAEEVGVTGVELTPWWQGDVAYADDDVAEVARLYAVTWDGPVTFADGEVVEARWVTSPSSRSSWSGSRSSPTRSRSCSRSSG